MADWSSTASWVTLAITLALSVISPIITTWMNHRFQLKLAELDARNKEIENHYLKKRDIIEKFISATGKCLFHANDSVLRECGESFYAIYAYTPASLWPDIDRLLLMIRKREYEQAQDHFSALTKSLSGILQESGRPNPPI